MKYVCASKTHFVHAQKLLQQQCRTLFNKGEDTIRLQAGDSEGQQISAQGVMASIYSSTLFKTMFVKSFVYRRQGGKLQRLGKDMLCQYVDNVPPKGSKRGHNFELIQNFCKTAWENMQKHGIWATDCWVLDELEPHEFIALNYVNHSWVSDQVVARSSALQR